VGRAAFLLESHIESSMVWPLENEVPVQADARFSGVKRSGRSKIDFRATVTEKYIT
jgi:hypothetical protein